MLISILFLIISVSITVRGVAEIIRLHKFVPLRAVCKESNPSTLPHAKKGQYYSKYEYVWNDEIIVSSDNNSTPRPMPVGETVDILVNPANPTEMLLACDKTFFFASAVLGVIFSIVAIVCMIVL